MRLSTVRLSPTIAVSTNQYGEWTCDRPRLARINKPAINQTIRSMYQDFVFAKNIEPSFAEHLYTILGILCAATSIFCSLYPPKSSQSLAIFFSFLCMHRHHPESHNGTSGAGFIRNPHFYLFMDRGLRSLYLGCFGRGRKPRFTT